MRLRLLACAVVAVLTAATLGTPAEAASKKPGAVGLVSVTGAAPYDSSGKKYAKISISWPKATRAKKYQVFVAGSRAGVAKAKKPRVTVKSRKATITKLKRNRTYWIQVRAVNGSKAGKRSARIARVTPAATAKLWSKRHPVYRLMSYNVCSNACSKWETRQPLVVNEVLRLKPDVLAVQEASRWKNAVIPGYTETLGGKDNRIFYRTAAFEQVTQRLSATQQSAECPLETDPRTGKVVRDDEGDPVRVEPCILPLDGVAEPEGKDAPWSVLRHKASGQAVVFVGIHLKVDEGGSNAAVRARQTSQIFTDLGNQLAWWGKRLHHLPVVLLGDFNTNRSRAGNSRLETVMQANGFYDAYEQALKVSRQHFNTANPRWSTQPIVGVTWGDHVDKVWVRPGRSRVHQWANVGKMSGGRFVAPLPSDHHPLMVRAQVS
ncbi:endonuclease/exonuclease/phosphatase family protein [Aeromicrobium tamlense]|uniref:Endonuclease/exonuclease/phosphatase family metal-dependent hydrolase n=1 Tax=Aeromicrobium tamlense TaxID=375541 RepID=A0A8I0FSW0_9ACTN|nr:MULTISPECIES: endonuclease/exonuclease/phosphatase family protein [Aeromicrobium]MBD1269490.1 endonuclease/exonuclease/phosphatase family protein [Aeromicrobium tamlense]NYI39856.1 endonuclease/exonuclease/phosphatase family metal-dependent hydrolase [Aeromicrobium tamlense]